MTTLLSPRNKRDVPRAPSLVIPNPRDETIPCRFCTVTVRRWFWEHGVKRSGMFLLNQHLEQAHTGQSA